MRNDISNICRISVATSALILLAACATTAVEETPPPAESVSAAPPPPEAQAPAETVQLQPAAPQKYVVQKGDTLWGISQKFLQDPWQWPEVWYVNEQVKNPHLIYPGDVLYLFWADGRPRIAREGEGGAPVGAGTGVSVQAYTGPEGKLSPRVRELPIDQAIAAIPRDVIAGFLRGPRIIEDLDVLEDAPYVLDFNDPHLMNASAADEVAYVLDIEDQSVRDYQIVRIGKRYIDPDDGDTIGYEAIPVGDAEVRVFGDPSTVVMTRSDIETKPGDRLLPHDRNQLDAHFVPHAPANTIDGQIIDVFDGDTQIGQYHIIAINRGKEHGIENGHVLSVLQSGRLSPDPNSVFGSKVQLPDIHSGTVMVFKTEERVCLALVMVALRQIHVGDKVEKPEPSPHR